MTTWSSVGKAITATAATRSMARGILEPFAWLHGMWVSVTELKDFEDLGKYMREKNIRQYIIRNFTASNLRKYVNSGKAIHKYVTLHNCVNQFK